MFVFTGLDYWTGLLDWDQLTYTAPEVENLKRSFPSGYAYETRACEVGAVQKRPFYGSSWLFFLGCSRALEDNNSTRNTHGKGG